MKRILLFVLICLVGTNILNAQKKLKLKGVLMQNDYHEKISWVKSKPTSIEKKDFSVSALATTYLQIYFGIKEKDGKPFLTNIRLINHFDDKDWVFFDEVSYLLGSRKEIREHKGNVFKITTDDNVRNVDNGITEHSDIVAVSYTHLTLPTTPYV